MIRLMHVPVLSHRFGDTQVSGSSANATTVQVPLAPVQVRHAPQADVPQQCPSTQNPLVQSVPTLQESPRLRSVVPQLVPLQVAVPLGAPGQGVQEVVPQLLTLAFEAQALPQGWKPLPQVKPHLVPSQVAVPFVGVAQAVQDVAPQLLTLVFETHAVPHR